MWMLYFFAAIPVKRLWSGQKRTIIEIYFKKEPSSFQGWNEALPQITGTKGFLSLHVLVILMLLHVVICNLHKWL